MQDKDRLGKALNKMKKLSKSKKGLAAVNFLQVAIIGLIIAIITLTIGLGVNETVTDNMRADNNTCEVGTVNDNHRWSSTESCGPTDADGLQNWTCVCPAYNSSIVGTTGLATFGSYWAVIVIVIILAAIIALFGMFGGGGIGGIQIR